MRSHQVQHSILALAAESKAGGIGIGMKCGVRHPAWVKHHGMDPPQPAATDRRRTN